MFDDVVDVSSGARVVPIQDSGGHHGASRVRALSGRLYERPSRRRFHYDEILRFALSNPRYLNWVITRPLIVHFTDEILLAQLLRARAEEVSLYYNGGAFEIAFRLGPFYQRIDIPNLRWGGAVLLRLKHLALINPYNHLSYQVGEIVVRGVTIRVWAYPTARSERVVLRPQWRRLGAGGPEQMPAHSGAF